MALVDQKREMTSASSKHRVLFWCELGAAIALTLCAIGLHIRVLTHAGPLWRDEISSLHLASQPTLAGFFHWIVFDVFPVFFYVVLKGWLFLGLGQNDFGLRVFGFLVGLLLLIALWLDWVSDRKSRLPLWPLVLLGLNPFVIHDGDSLRAYGLGMLLIILTYRFVKRLAFQDWHTREVMLAATAAVLSVQTLYVNALLVFAICIAGIGFLFYSGDRRRAAAVLAVGVIAALSLLPYSPFFSRSYEMRAMQRSNTDLSAIVSASVESLTNHSLLAAMAWGVVIIAAVSVLILRSREGSIESRKWLLFAMTTLVVSAVITAGFLWMSGWFATRYFLPLIAVASLCLHDLSGTLVSMHLVARTANVLGAVAVAASCFPSSYEVLSTRSTNCDMAAATVAQAAGPNDLVIVTAFTFGISFQRYYHGAAQWRTVPEVADHTLHRWDLALQAMTIPDPIRDTLSDIENVLRSGNKVFLVGALPEPDKELPEILPPTRSDAAAWPRYEDNWRRRLTFFLEQHGVSGAEVPVNVDHIVSPLEDLGVFFISGWRETPADSHQSGESR